MDVLATITNLEHLELVARAFAFFADEFHVGEELHLDRHRTVTLASFAASAGNVEGKMPGRETSLLRLGQGSEQVADAVEGLDVGNRIRARRSPDRRLVNQDHFVNELSAFKLRPIRRRRERPIGLFLGRRQRRIENVVQ